MRRHFWSIKQKCKKKEAVEEQAFQPKDLDVFFEKAFEERLIAQAFEQKVSVPAPDL